MFRNVISIKTLLGLCFYVSTEIAIKKYLYLNLGNLKLCIRKLCGEMKLARV